MCVRIARRPVDLTIAGGAIDELELRCGLDQPAVLVLTSEREERLGDLGANSPAVANAPRCTRACVPRRCAAGEHEIFRHPPGCDLELLTQRRV